MSLQQEFVLKNAVIWGQTPMAKIDGGMHIRDGKVFKLYSLEEAPKGDASSVDLKGMHVIPGLIDAHRHFFISALLPQHGDASTWTSKDNALGAIEAACRSKSSDSGWVFFSGMDHLRWNPPQIPGLKEIDAAAHGSPVIVVDTTFHSGMASTQALMRSGISRDRLRCPIDMDINRDGTPKGTIWEDALSRVLFTMFREIFQTYTEEEKRKIIIDEAQRCLSKGLTHVHDPGIPTDIQMLLKDAQQYTPLKMSWSVTDFDSMFAPPTSKVDEDALVSDYAPRV
jgi:predicted amidohydrolase YtcJ